MTDAGSNPQQRVIVRRRLKLQEEKQHKLALLPPSSRTLRREEAARDRIKRRLETIERRKKAELEPTSPSALRRIQRRNARIEDRLKRQKVGEHKLSTLPPALLKKERRRRRREDLIRIDRPYTSWDGSKVEVLLLSYGSDYASLTNTLAECLRSVDVNAIAIIHKPFHPRFETEFPPLYDPITVRGMAETADVIVWMHSLLYPPLEKMLEKRKCVVFHGGTRYRKSYKNINARFNSRVRLSLVQTGELLGRGAKNEHWFLPPVDTKFLKPNYSFEQDDKLVIGHFSSHLGIGSAKKIRTIKGTSEIIKVIESLRRSKLSKDFDYRMHGKVILPWEENLARMSKCDVYIESLSQALTGKNRHDWSITALEACALGCITMTNFLFEKQYLKEYGEHGLIVANTADELETLLTVLLHKDREELLELKQKARQWVEEMHSYKAVGERLKTVLEI